MSIPFPEHKDLYPFQIEGSEWLATRSHALLADEPGLGKSAQIVVAADIVRASTILVMSPAGVKLGWRDQVRLWSMYGHDVNVIMSSDQRPFRNMVNIVNYELLSRGFVGNVGYKKSEFLKSFLEWDWDVVAGDEAHGLKDQNSLRTMAIMANDSIAGRAKRLWLLSGTPMPNHAGELWVPLVSLGATTMEYKDWVDRYCTVGKWGFSRGKPTGTREDTSQELKELLRSVMMRRFKKFVLPQLPKCRIDDFPLEQVPIKVEEFFEEALLDKNGVIDKIKQQEAFVRECIHRNLASGEDFNTMDMINVLEGLGPSVGLYRRWLGAVKTVSLLPIIEDELENGAIGKLVIFAFHRQVIYYLAAKLKKFGVQIIDGSVSMPKRHQQVADFKTNANRVQIIQNITGSEGLDGLQHAASDCILVEPEWTPRFNAQAIMRLHRIGQRNFVQARVARLADTLDDYISETLVRKTKEIANVLGD